MPEIVEVEKLRRQMAPAWWTRKIKRFTWSEFASVDPRKFVQGDWDEFARGVLDVPIFGIWRVGKLLWVALGLDRNVPVKGWKIHLSSTGWILPGNELAAKSGRIDPIYQNFLHSTSDRTIRIRIELHDGQVWNYHDARTWSKWELSPHGTPLLDPQVQSFGPDWLEYPEKASEALSFVKTRRRLKDVLTDQKVAAGLGNYLACEAAYLAGLHPHRRFDTISTEHRALLCGAITILLRVSLGSPDHSHWNVFKRKGEECNRCKSPIQYVKDSGGKRGSYFCGVCQIT